MRIPIREQLGALVLLTTLTALAVISIASWVVNYNRVIALRTQYLGLTAALKAAQLSSNLDLMERSVRSLSTRVKLQQTLIALNNGTSTNAMSAFASFGSDLATALSAPESDVLTLQVMVFDAYSGNGGVASSLLNVTAPNTNVSLPYGGYLGDSIDGYPPNLYPNLTYANDSDGRTYAYYGGQKLLQDSAVFLGPWQTNATFALSSITLAVINNASNTGIIGYMTVVLDSRLILDVLNSPVGLDQTGCMLLVGPNTANNDYLGYSYVDSLPFSNGNESGLLDQPVHFVLPPNETYKNPRHTQRAYGTAQAPFYLRDFPMVRDAVTSSTGLINNQGGHISTTNEQGEQVSIGYAIPSTRLVDWVLLLEQAKSEVYQPIVMLRKVLLACVFGSAAAIIILTLPIAHYSSRPIRRLRDATEKSIIRMDTQPSTLNEKDPDESGGTVGVESGRLDDLTDRPPVNKFPWMFWKAPQTRESQTNRYRNTLKKQYPIPETVKARRAWIQDELTDLTQYFNEMSDELVLFYGKLEERVRQRTAELETAKKAAEAANESKTLFIGNISHELRTPLNGILGMTAVCMQEDDPEKIKRSLSIIYKSGDLLHNLLTDLLTFSKNQSNQIQLVEAEFPLRDIGTQIRALFQNQAKEGRVNFNISYEGCRDALGSSENTVSRQYGPPGTGRVKDMHLWGDMQRILQVVINLVSNSLKFTPPEGSVNLTIRVLDNELAESVRTGRSPSRRSSNHSKASKKLPRLRILSRNDSDTSPTSEYPSYHSQPMLVDVAAEEKNQSRQSLAPEQTSSNAPFNTHLLRFEFEVEDTGPGIAKHLQTKIFEPFVQGDLRLTKKFGGTGLGLSICSQLAKLMHGSISLDSTEGVGSKFVLHLPLKLVKTKSDSNATSPHNSVPGSVRSSIDHSAFGPAPRHHTKNPETNQQATASSSNNASNTYFDTNNKKHLVGLSHPYFSSSKAPMASPSADDAVEAKSSRLRVLVAEDNSINQEVVVRMLRLEEIFDVHLAKDGQEALDKVKESMQTNTPYDLIFMDVQM